METLEELLARLDRRRSCRRWRSTTRTTTTETIERLRTLADQFGLIPLGGSDYHGLGNPRQREPGNHPLADGAGRALSRTSRVNVASLGRARGPAAGVSIDIRER